ncbi:MAG TPA: hypothetical protein VF396_24685 [Bradyrhizobium sp.]
MAKATRVYSTPPTNTSAIDHPMFPPRDPTRRRFLAVAAVASVVSAGTLAAAAAMDPSVPAAVTIPNHGRPDPAFALIAEKLAADVAHCEAIDGQDKADVEHGYDSQAAWEANDRCEVAGHAVNVVDWRLARTPPATLAGVAAVLRFANEIEDGGMEWPNTDTIGREGWHYQLRATMAAALEALINAQGGKAVRS